MPRYNVAAYIRLSMADGDKVESDSVTHQKKILQDFIDSNPEFELYDIYVDDGYTGTNFNRPGFVRMMDDVEDGHVNCVLVKDLSRFGRDYIDTGHYLERLFPKYNVRFIAVIDGIDSHKQAYDMMLPIKNILNEQYSKDISRKIQAVVKSKQQAGEFIGAFAPYGYKKSKQDKHKLVIDEYPASVVRRIFDMFIAGNGMLSIAKQLNKEGIVSPTEYKKLSGDNYCNSNRLDKTIFWTQSTVRRILKHEVYIGNMVQGTRHQNVGVKQKTVNQKDWIVVKNTHEPIIDMETWNRAQSLFSLRTRDWQNDEVSVWAGLLRCGDCGRALVKYRWKHKDGSATTSYVCGTYKRVGLGYCTRHMIRGDVLEKIVLSDLKEIVSHINDIEQIIKAQNMQKKRAKISADAEIYRLKNELERVKKYKQSLYEDYKEGMVSKSDYITYRDDYNKKETLYASQLEALDKRDEDKEDILSNPWIKRLLELKEIDRLDRETVIEMISRIWVYENNRIKIIYRFSDELAGFFPNNFNNKE